MAGDVISSERDHQPGDALVKPVMRGGKRINPPPSLLEIRSRAERDLERLPESLRRLDPSARYPVIIGEALHRLAAEADRHVVQQEIAAS
jgi:nicotinate phosphoribosyltransferase